MKRLFLILLIVATFSCNAWSASYTVEWGYTPPSSPAVTGFRLYRNNAQVVDWTGASITSGVFTATLTIGDVFELTALFADATESPRSAQYVWSGAPVIRFGSLKNGNTHGSMSKPGMVRIQ